MKTKFLLASLYCAVSMAQQPQFTADGQMKRPENYREWIFLSAGLGMNYGSPNGNPERFDNVFVAPDAYRQFLKTGTWPEGTLFALELRESTSKGSINKGGHFQEAVTGLEFHVKDSARFPTTKWAFYEFGTDKLTAKQLPLDSRCQSCHSQNGAVDETFVQFYPTLIPVAKAKGTFKPAPEK